MSLNEICEAIHNGKNVYWMHKGYKVILDNDRLYTIFISNAWMCGLQDSELKDCFIGDLLK